MRSIGTFGWAAAIGFASVLSACASAPSLQHRPTLNRSTALSVSARVFHGGRNIEPLLGAGEWHTLVFGPLGGAARGPEKIRALLRREWSRPKLADVRLSEPLCYVASTDGDFASVECDGWVDGLRSVAGVHVARQRITMYFSYGRSGSRWYLAMASLTLPQLTDLAPRGRRTRG